MLHSTVLCLLAVWCHTVVAESYFPKILYGTPLSVDVVEKQGDDFRGLPVYLITLTVEESEGGAVVDSLVHRNYDEFKKLVDRVNENGYSDEEGQINLPGADDVTVEELDTLLKGILELPGVTEWTTFTDFMAINWNADGVKWFESVESFMYMLLFARIPDFQPEPAVFESEVDVTHPEVPFEKYVYMTAFRHEEVFGTIEVYSAFFKNWTDSTPAFDGPAGDVDVLPPNAVGPIDLPYHYTKTFVHFLPGGYTNGHTVRISQTGNTKFNFLKENIIKQSIQELHGNRTLRRILDIGTGNCHSAFAFAEMYPEAEVYGIDLAAPYIRFCNIWKQEKGLTNVHFYQDNAESTHFDDEFFDLIQYTYVLHEMPAENAEMVLEEAMRMLVPGGVLSGFEVPFVENFVARQAAIAFQTWGCAWNSTDCGHGPEPYTGEYLNGTRLPRMLKRIGFVGTQEIFFSVFDGIYVTNKPE